MAIKKTTLTDGQKPTKAQLKRIAKATQYPVAYDEDAPKLSVAELAEFKRVKDSERETVICSIRVPKQTLDYWKSLGKGYTGIMARLLEFAQQHPELIKECM